VTAAAPAECLFDQGLASADRPTPRDTRGTFGTALESCDRLSSGSFETRRHAPASAPTASALPAEPTSAAETSPSAAAIRESPPPASVPAPWSAEPSPPTVVTTPQCERPIRDTPRTRSMFVDAQHP
jgi:hypothetical protein